MVQRGSFQWLDGDVVLAMDPNMRREMAPDVAIYRGGVLAVPIGRSIVLPLSPGIVYEVRNATGALPPYVILGQPQPLAADRHFDHFEDIGKRRRSYPDGPISMVAHPLVLSSQDGGDVATVPWQDRPWSDDSARLADLARHCEGPSGTGALSAQRTGDQINIRFGRCSSKLSVPSAERPVMAVLAGPDWATVTKSGESWRVVSLGWTGDSMQMVVALVVLVLVICAGLSPIGAAATAFVLAPLSFYRPFEAFVIFLAIVPISAAAIAVRMTRHGFSHRHRARIGAIVVALSVVVAAYLRMREADLGDALAYCDQYTDTVSDEPPACMVVGYSTANDSGVGFGVRGTFGLLDTECPACSARTTRIACEGRAFDTIKDILCSDSIPLVAPGGQVLFLGGGNDDWMWPWHSSSFLHRAREGLGSLALLFEMVHLVSPTEFRAPSMRSEPTDLQAELESPQMAVYAEAAACAGRREMRLWILHDFFKSDLAYGRGTSRQALLEMRRQAVTGHGADFVDLLDEFQNEAGVAWFSDIIHLSAVGHRRIANRVCEKVSGDRGPI